MSRVGAATVIMALMTTDIITAIAEAALAHRHTVERRMLGLPVRGRVGERIDAELARRGIRPVSFSPATPSHPPPSGRAA